MRLDPSHTGCLRLQPASWSALSSMVVLGVQFNQLEGTVPSSWTTWSGVTSLDLSNNRLGGTLPQLRLQSAQTVSIQVGAAAARSLVETAAPASSTDPFLNYLITTVPIWDFSNNRWAVQLDSMPHTSSLTSCVGQLVGLAACRPPGGVPRVLVCRRARTSMEALAFTWSDGPQHQHAPQPASLRSAPAFLSQVRGLAARCLG